MIIASSGALGEVAQAIDFFTAKGALKQLPQGRHVTDTREAVGHGQGSQAGAKRLLLLERDMNLRYRLTG